MPSLIKNNGRYYVQFYDKERSPQRKQVALHTEKKPEARRRKNKLVAQWIDGEYDPWSPKEKDDDMPIQGVWELYEEFFAAKEHLSEATHTKYAYTIERFLDTIHPSASLSSIGPYDIRTWLHDLPIKNTSKHSYLRELNVFFAWCVKHDHLDENPCADVELPSIPNKFPQYLTFEEVVRLVETIERESRSAQWLADMVWVAVYTGMRRSELTSLKWDDVHWEEDKIRVQGETSKSQKDRWIPMTPTVVEVLEDRRGDSDLAWVFTHSNGKIKGNTASTMFRTYARKAGFEEISLHGLRHTACSWLAMQGASIEAIREFAGHSTTGVTEKYMHLSPKAYHDQVRDAFDSV